MPKVLIIDDDRVFCDMLSLRVKQMGLEVACALTLKEGLAEVVSTAFDIVFLDVRMPDGSGLEILPQVKATPSTPEVIIITGQGDADGAEIAIKNGAWDYIEKPSTMQQMVLPLSRALQYREEKLAKRPPLVLKRDNIVGNSPLMSSCLDLLAQAAGGVANVLITGETGTGKELFAQAIHENSDRDGRRFVVVDCTALPESLAESMLFGHVKGAFTGAHRTRDGLIRQADGGTLFLDEVGELPLNTQKTFLRVLQEHRFRPIGSKEEVESHFRLISATNRDLDKMAVEGSLRQDLLFRLRAFAIRLPPLRERREDIKDVVLYHTAKLCERDGLAMKGFSPEFFDALSAYDWPGNVRELVNTLESALNAARQENILFPTHLPVHIRVRMVRNAFEKETRPLSATTETALRPTTFPAMKTLRKTAVAAAERQYLEELMALTEGNINEACRISQLSRTRFYALLRKHGMHRLEPLNNSIANCRHCINRLPISNRNRREIEESRASSNSADDHRNSQEHRRSPETLIGADSTQIHKVILNLCAIAGHAMREHGGVLEVDLSDLDLDSSQTVLQADLQAGPYVRLAVCDTGHGMGIRKYKMSREQEDRSTPCVVLQH